MYARITESPILACAIFTMSATPGANTGIFASATTLAVKDAGDPVAVLSWATVIVETAIAATKKANPRTNAFINRL